MGLNLVALLWGFAEATLFFIVPDVLLTAVAVWRGRRAALRAVAWTIAGAMIGGALIYGWAGRDQAAVTALIDKLPAISPSMIAGVGDALDRLGAGAMAIGSLSGVPYKIYAAMAPQAGIPLWIFLAASIPARALRFLLVVLIADWINQRLPKRLTQRQRGTVLAAVWLLFYGVYFSAMPN